MKASGGNREWQQKSEVDSEGGACVLAQQGYLRHREPSHFNGLVGHLKKRLDCRFFQSDFCLWGMAWRKATGFLAGFCNPARVERICQNGTCKRTGERHTGLAGIVPVSKCFWTHIAEAYPRGLSPALTKTGVCLTYVLTVLVANLCVVLTFYGVTTHCIC